MNLAKEHGRRFVGRLAGHPAFHRVSKAATLAKVLTTPNHRLIQYYGWVGQSNLGDEALFDAIRNCFSPRFTIRHAPHVANRALSRVLALRKPTAVMLGGGTLVGAGTIWDAFAEAVEMGRTGLLFGSGVSTGLSNGFSVRPVKHLIRTLLQCQYIGVRGPRSAEILSDAGLRVEVLGDPGCQYTLERRPHPPSEKLLGVNFGTTSGMWGSVDQALATLAESLMILRGHGWRFRFFVVWPQDLLPTVELVVRANLQDCSEVICEYHDAARFMDQVSRTAVFIGFKLHSAIFALCAHVPSVLLAYRPKVFDFAESVGIEREICRTDALNADWIVSMAESASLSSVRPVVERMRAFAALQLERTSLIMNSLG